MSDRVAVVFIFERIRVSFYFQLGAHLIDVDLSFLVDPNRGWIHLRLFFLLWWIIVF